MKQMILSIFKLVNSTLNVGFFKDTITRKCVDSDSQLLHMNGNFMQLFCSIGLFLLLTISSHAASRSTVAAGSWSASSTWQGGGAAPTATDVVTVNHGLNLNSNLTINGAGLYTFNASSTGGTPTVTINGGELAINSPATVNLGSVDANAGVIHVYSGATLNITGNLTSDLFGTIIVDAGGTLNVSGNLSNTSSNITANGTIVVGGNFTTTTILADWGVDGSGTITSGGSMISNGPSEIFGSTSSCNTGPCDGNNLTCYMSNTITTANQTICSGTTASTFVASTIASATYQWQSSTNGTSFTNIVGATAKDYPPGAITTTTYYRRVATKGCTNYSQQRVVTVAVPPVAPAISYSASSYCTSATTKTVTQTGTTGGTYTASPSGLSINASTGLITPSSSSVNSYTVTYTTPASGCTQLTATANVSISSAAPAKPGTITIPTNQCAGSTGNTYSITAVTGATSYTWSVTGTGWSIPVSSSTTSVSVKIGTGAGIVSVTASNGCGTSSAATTGSITPSTKPNTPGTITKPTNQCAGSTGNTYSIAAVTGATSYTWSVTGTGTGWSVAAGGTTTSGAVTIGAGVGTVSVTATNSCGTSAAATTGSITPTAAPAPPGTITKPTNQCAGSIGNTYTIAAVTGATSYTWSVTGTGWSVAAGGTTTSGAVTIGTGAGTVSVTANNACPSAASSVNITPTTKPNTPGTITKPTNQCAGTAGNSYSIAAVTGATSYTWSVTGTGWSVAAGGTTTSGAVTIGTGAGTVSVTASNGCGTSLAATTGSITPTTKPNTPGTITTPTNQCAGTAGNSYSIAAVTGATSYTWSVTGTGWSIPVSSSTTSVNVSIGTGAGTVSVTASNACGTSAAATTGSITPTTKPNTPGTITTPASQCAGTTGNAYSIAAVTGATSYTWSVTGTGWSIPVSSSTTSASITIGTGAGIVSVTASNGCGTSSAANTVSITPTTAPDALGTISTPVNQCAGTAGNTYSIASVVGATSYTWSVTGTGWSIPVSSSTTSVNVTIGTGAGTISVTATNGCGTSSAATTGSITPTDSPSAVGTITGSTAVCVGETGVTYSISPVSNATTYSWSVPSGATITSGAGTTSIIVSYVGVSGPTGSISVVAGNSCSSTTSNSTTVSISSSCALTWTGSTDTDWNTAGNWIPSIIPISTDDVTIPSSVVSGNMPTISTTANVKSLTNNGTIIFTAAGILNVTGNITNSGTVTPAAGSKVSFVGSTAQTITGVASLYNVVINNTNTSGGVSLASALTVKGTLSLTQGVLTTNSNLTIDFDAGGEIGYASGDQGSISGLVTGRRFASVRTHYIAAPFSGVTTAQVQATTPLYVNSFWKMYAKNFTTQNWTAVTNTTTAMPLGTGFSLSLPAAAPLIFTGTYNHSFTFTTPLYSNAAVGKYLLVGNPYPSAIDWSAASGWTKTNVADAIYFWDPANNRAASFVAGLGTNGATRYIPAMTSFMVTTTGTGGSSSIGMNNNVRLSLQNQNPGYWRVASDDVIRLTLIGSDTTKRDEAVIRFNEMATDTFDFELDANKILNTGVMPSVYTSSGSDIYSINSYASVDSAQYIPVAAKLPKDGNYTLKIAGNNPNMDYILVDKQLGTQRSIETDSVYTFSGLRTDDVNRFELQLRVSVATVATGVQSASMNSGLNIYSSTKGFVIKTDRYAGENAEIEILDVTGNSVKILSGKNLSTGSTYVPLDMADGTYLIKVNVEGNAFAGMIVLTK